MIYSNPEYAKLFPFEIPKQIHLRGIGLNCGMYDFARTAARKDGGLMNGLIKDYLGNDVKNYNTKYGEMLKVLDYINENYPPAYIMTAYHDFLKEHAQPMCQFLTEKGVKSAWKCYGTKEQAYMSHVCHVNMNLAEAKEMNQDECEFFRGLM